MRLARSKAVRRWAPFKEELRRQLRLSQRGEDTHWLAPMKVPRGSETVIVFATRPDESAKDGTGRNSGFGKLRTSRH